jgi:hypothetical protein
MSNAPPEILGPRLSRDATTLRAWPLVLSGATGLALLALHVVFELGDKPPRLSGLLLEVGAALLLFAVLLVVQVKLVERAVSAARAVTAEEFASSLAETGGNPLTPGDFYEETGPFAVASAVVSGFATGNLRDAWLLCDANFRRCRAMAWVYNHRDQIGLPEGLTDDVEGLVETLASLRDAPGRLTELFVMSESNQYAKVLKNFDDSRWGWSHRRRIVGPRHEIILALPLPIDAPDGLVVDRPMLVGDSIKVLVSCEPMGDQTVYLVAAINLEAPPLPTWPPTWWIIDDPAAGAAHPGAAWTA